MSKENCVKATTFYSREEVKKHNKDGDIWLIIDCVVYDVSKWIQKHPGNCILSTLDTPIFSHTFELKILSRIIFFIARIYVEKISHLEKS